MGWPSIARVIGLGAGGALVALALPLLLLLLGTHSSPPAASPCEAPAYHTELISLDPLLVYVHDFLRPHEMDSLLATAEPLFKPSQVTKAGRKLDSSVRTSSTAGLLLDDATVQCVLA